MEKFVSKILVLFFLNSVLFAQINIEKHRKTGMDLGFSGLANISISAKTGNKDIQEIDLEGRIDYQGEMFYTFAVAQGEYGWQGGKEFSNQALLHLRYVHGLFNRIKLEIFTQMDYNKARLLLFRSLAGAGLRFNLIKSKTSSLSFGIAGMAEHEKYDLPVTAVHPVTTSVFRISNYLAYRLKLNGTASLASVIYYQPKAGEFKDSRILSENSLRVKISKRVSLSAEFNLRYDRKPPDGKKALDTKTKFGFSVSF